MRSSRQNIATIVFLVTCTFAGATQAATAHEDTLQYALERLTSGTSATARVGDTAVTITPTRTWKSVSGHYCREYEMIVAKPDIAPDQVTGVRCRESDGAWKKVK